MPHQDLADAGRPQPFNPAKRLARRLGLTGAARKVLAPVNRVRAGSEGGLMRIKGWIQERHCKPLTDPPFVPASEADFMRDDDTVLGLEFNGDARAYPWWIMDNHHVANDIVGGQPIEVILWEVCSAAVAFNPMVNGGKAGGGKKVYQLAYLRGRGVVNDTLGTSPIVILFRVEEGSYAGLAFSRVVNGQTLTFTRTPEGPVDEETKSRWSMEGKAISGPLEGTELDYVSCHVSEFYIWGAHYKDIEIAS